jgi:hypothetical protein
MATPTFVVNTTIACYGVFAGWQRVQKRRTPGGITWQNYALHTWDISQMEMSVFLSLLALQGQRLTSLATTAIGDVNNGATYTSAEITTLSGAQTGRRAVDVRIEFRVDIS